MATEHNPVTRTQISAQGTPLGRLPLLHGLALPFGVTVTLAAFVVLDRVRASPPLTWSFVGASAVLLVWNAQLLVSGRRQHRTLVLKTVLRPQHYVQACAHAAIFIYWGWYWPQVYESFHLVIAQLVFAYAFDMLLAWSRRDTYSVGFGQFPVIFSTNLFLWFKPEWFYLQFLMVAVGFAAKELIRWEKDGRRTHIFNPSSFSLSVFSLGLIVAGATDMTWAQEIAVTQFFPPHMYLFLFAVSLPGQYLFGVTTMTMAAVVTMYVFGLGYHAATGVYFFYDSYIPIAVFLGMHLLFTDPSTSPRTELGRMIFGALYALGIIALYRVLLNLGVPAAYDKLLPVPVLNLFIQVIDHAAKSSRARWFDVARIAPAVLGRRRHLASICVGTAIFVMMSAVQGVGDDHRGQWLSFWLRACDDNNAKACAYLAGLETISCRLGSGWACNELGILQAERRGDRARAAAALDRGCRLGFTAACENVPFITSGSGTLRHAAPTLTDYPIILKGSKGPIRDLTSEGIRALACRQGWPDTCTPDDRLAR